jgi:HNH endonuclease
MKTCGGKNCNKLVKNTYTHCFECNNKATKEDSSSDVESSPYVKESIPRAVKNCMWIDAFQDSRVGKCQCCLREPITLNNFHAGHVISERNGGKTTLDNLRCICAFCNVSMRTQNMDEFIARYNLHHNKKPLNKNM